MFYNMSKLAIFQKNNKIMFHFIQRQIQQLKFNEKVYSSLEKKFNFQFTILTDI